VAASGVTVVTATHDPFVIEHVDRILEMDDGALISRTPEVAPEPVVRAASQRALPPRRPPPGL
jgi:ABC-type lipoprotein export system ATPase subunit